MTPSRPKNQQVEDEVKLALVTPREEAKKALKVQIDKGKDLLNISVRTEAEYDDFVEMRRIWIDYTVQLLKNIFNTDQCAKDFKSAQGARITLGRSSLDIKFKGVLDGAKKRLGRLESIFARIDIIPEAQSQSSPEVSDIDSKLLSASNKVFVVHGHDDASKKAVESFLTKLKLEPIILHDKANAGKTLIEKIEHHANVAFTIVLLTPDDLGKSQASSEELAPRARQNVILEQGYFIGKLGRSRVCALHKAGVELPSDMNGVLYVPLDDQEGWHIKLAKEMKEVGLKIDMNLII